MRPIALLLAVLSAARAAAPQIVSSRGEIEKTCILTDMGQGETGACFWGMVLDITFDQDIYVCDSSAGGPCASGLRRIDMMPNTPPAMAGTQGTAVGFPLHVATMGAFRVKCSKPNFQGFPAFAAQWNLRGQTPVQPMYKVMRNDGDTSEPSLPEVTSGSPLYEDGIAKCESLLSPSQTLTDGCTDLPNWSVAPWTGGEIATQFSGGYPYTPGAMEEACNVATMGVKYFCHGGVTRWTYEEAFTMNFVMTPSADAMFEYTLARSGINVQLSQPQADHFKAILLMPEDFEENLASYVADLNTCEPEIIFGDMVEHSTPWGVMPEGKAPFAPTFIQSATGEKATGSVTFSGFTDAKVGQCSYDKFMIMGNAMSAIIDRFKTATDMNEIMQVDRAVRAMVLHPTIANCNRLLQNMVQKESATLTIAATLECQEPSTIPQQTQTGMVNIVNPKWENDCRCNEVLQYTTCCVPAGATRSIERMTAVVDTVVNQQCSNPTEILLLVNDAVLEGSATTPEPSDVAIQQLWQDTRAFMDECQNAMHSESTCLADADCKYGKICAMSGGTGRCRLDFTGDDSYITALTMCYLESMDTETRRYFQMEVGVAGECQYKRCPDGTTNCVESLKSTDTSVPCYQTIFNALKTQYSVDECHGRDSDNYFNHEDGTPDLTGCVADGWCLGDRNRHHSEDAVKPIGDPSSPACPGEGEYKCFQCWDGNDCEPIGRESACLVAGPHHKWMWCDTNTEGACAAAQRDCEAAGYTWQFQEEHQRSQCVNTAATTVEECIDSSLFDHASLVDGIDRVAGAEEARCLYTGSNPPATDEACSALGHSMTAGFHAEITDSRFKGVCGSWPNWCSDAQWIDGTCAIGCTQAQLDAGFTLWPGFEWRKGKYDTAEKCTFGCSQEDLFWRGASEAQCTSKKTCTSQCERCYSHFEDPTATRPEEQYMCLDSGSKYTGTAEWPNDPHTLCTDAGGSELLSAYGETSPGIWQHIATYGCLFTSSTITSQAACEAATGSTSTTEFYQCSSFGQSECSFHTSTGRGYPSGMSEKMKFIQERIGCDWRDHVPCRSDAELCALPVRPNEPAGLDCTKSVSDNSLLSSECAERGSCLDDDFWHFEWDDSTRRASYGCVLPMGTNKMGHEGCFETCTGPGTPDQSCQADGQVVRSSTYSHSRYGCMWKAKDGATESQCISQGGYWSRKAKTQDECAAQGPGGKVCKTPWGGLSPHSPDNNDMCPVCLNHWSRGQTEPQAADDFATWQTASYFVPRMSKKLFWKQVERVPVRYVSKSIDHGQMEPIIGKIVAGKMGKQLASQFAADFLPKNALLATIACDCAEGADPNVNCLAPPPPSASSESSEVSGTSESGSSASGAGSTALTATQPQPVAVNSALSGVDTSLAAANRGSVTVPADAVADGSGAVSVELKSLSSAIMNMDVRKACVANPESCFGATRRRLQARRSLTSTTTVADYAVVKDACDMIVGQIVGDGLELASEQSMSATLCIVQRSDIPRDTSIYNTPDLVTSSAGGVLSTPLDATGTLGLTVTTTGDFCFTAQAGTTYVPIMRTPSYGKVSSDCSLPMCSAIVTTTKEQAAMTFNGNPFGCR